MHALNSTQIVFADKKILTGLKTLAAVTNLLLTLNLMYREMIFAPSINLTSITVESK